MPKPVITVVIADKPELLEQVYAIRKKVFVEEQNISRVDEFDDYEDIATHMLALEPDRGCGLGSARWRQTTSGVKLERFCVLPEFRRTGVASALVNSLLADIRSKLTAPGRIYLHAQLSAEPFYLSTGFVRVGEEFQECGIPHVAMQLVDSG